MPVKLNDPSRTTDYGFFPRERGKLTREIPSYEAVDRLVIALKHGQPVFGYSPSKIVEIISDLHNEEMIDLVLAALAPNTCPEHTKRALTKISSLAYRLANK